MRRGHSWKEENAGYVEKEKKVKHVLKECEATKNEMEEFLSKEANGLNIMKKIDQIREEKRTEKGDEVTASQRNPTCKER